MVIPVQPDFHDFHHSHNQGNFGLPAAPQSSLLLPFYHTACTGLLGLLDRLHGTDEAFRAHMRKKTELRER